MPTESHIGLVGFGRIEQYLADRIKETPHFELVFVCKRRPETVGGVGANVYADPADISDHPVDLIVEAATAGVVEEYGARLLSTSDLLTMSTTALADAVLKEELQAAAGAADTQLYLPHGAILGTDGLQDGRPSIESVSITTRKNPANIDFTHADIDLADIDEETLLYDGSTRGICSEYPRNVNSHATVAIAGLGFHQTESTLIADPSAMDATHRIIAGGEETRLEIRRSSAIEGVTGSYTLDSIWGTVCRILDDQSGLVVA